MEGNTRPRRNPGESELHQAVREVSGPFQSPKCMPGGDCAWSMLTSHPPVFSVLTTVARTSGAGSSLVRRTHAETLQLAVAFGKLSTAMNSQLDVQSVEAAQP
ncbi:hypothetical protein [Sorangium sp. So ce406]|uniref:hypothetical protein n=1 Tax=Sorangium sp. So ce406 TaxID=3133311 RepID=UPI003F5AE9E3